MSEIGFSLSAKRFPNSIGEYLRDQFFNQDNGELGCYSTFDIRNDVFQLPDEREDINDSEIDEFEFQEVYKCFEKNVDGNHVVMRYCWDEGDGTLEFVFDNGDGLINTDCKKIHDWEYLEV